MLVQDRLQFADPSTFNDPLNTKPTLNPDIDNEAVDRVLELLLVQRVEVERKAVAKTIQIKGLKTLGHIARSEIIGIQAPPRGSSIPRHKCRNHRQIPAAALVGRGGRGRASPELQQGGRGFGHTR